MSTVSGPGILRYSRWPLVRYSVIIIAVAGLSLLAWPGLLRNLFSDSFVPHGSCLLWEPSLLWLHVTSDTAIGLSYVAISFTLAWLVHRARKDIPFRWIFVAFGLFIIACGSTHLMEVVTLWYPFYWLSGDVKLITAIASVATAIVLPPLVPKTLTMIREAKLSEARRLQIERQNGELEEMTRKLREMDELKTQFFADALRTSESRYRRLVEANVIGVITSGADGTISDANDEFLRMIGHTREELENGELNWRELTPEKWAGLDAISVQQLAKDGVAGPWQKEYVRKDGSPVPVLLGSARLQSSDDITFVVDLTEQKRAQARAGVQYEVARVLADRDSLEDSAAQVLRTIGTRLQWDWGAMWVAQQGAHELACQAKWTRDHGNTGNANGCNVDSVEEFARSVKQAAAPSWKKINFDHVEDTAFSETTWALGIPIVVDGEVLGVLAFFAEEVRDPESDLLDLASAIGHQIGQFAQRKRNEAALRESEERFRSVVEAIPQIVWTTDPQGKPDFYNQRWYNYTGLNLAESQGGKWKSAIHPEDLDACVELWTASVQTGQAFDIEYRLRRRDGCYRWQLVRGVPLRDDKGRIVKWFGTLTDIDEQKRAEAAKGELAAIVESSEDAIIGTTLEGIVTTWNFGAERLFGHAASIAIGNPVWVLGLLDKHEILGLVQKLLQGERVQHFESTCTTKDGRHVQVALTMSLIRNDSGEVIGTSMIARDITESKRTEQVLRNTEKHAMVGRLAATMAHEINNPLEAVSNVLYLLGTRPSLDEEGRHYVSVAGQEVDRIAHIVKQTLGFYRESTSPVEVNMRQVVESILGLYSRKLQEKNIEVKATFDTVGSVAAYPAEIRQVMSNLIINAVEATSEGGKLRVHLYADRNWAHPNQHGVRIVVCDNGVGISPENRRNLFEPFFTTKGEKGTGLGLWVSNGIVQKHGGTIRVRSSVRPGRNGTCFAIFLPSSPNDRLTGEREQPRQQQLFSASERT